MKGREGWREGEERRIWWNEGKEGERERKGGKNQGSEALICKLNERD